MVLLRRLKSLWLALAVAVLNAGLPVLAYAAMAGKGGLTQMICSPAGMQMIAVDADGKARQVETQPPHGGHCLLCAMPMALPVPSSTPPAPSTAACGALRVGQTCVHLDSAVTTPPATGPPALA